MATNDVLISIGTPIVWADTTDYSSAGSGYTRTAQIDMTSVANGAARQGAKVDFGATHAESYSVFVGIEADVAPIAALEVFLYMSFSASATPGTGNSAGASGTDLAYQTGEELEWLRQALFVGTLVATADAATTVQVQCLNSSFIIPQRYGSPIIYNDLGQAFEGDAVEMFIAFVPNTPQIQAAV